jgi:hypothetical protein
MIRLLAKRHTQNNVLHSEAGDKKKVDEISEMLHTLSSSRQTKRFASDATPNKFFKN